MNLPQDAHILLIRFSSLGDVVKCTGLPRQIKKAYPKARITFLTAEEFLPLFESNPHVDQVLGFDRKSGLEGLLALASQLRVQRWDLIADIHRSLRSRVLCWLLRGKHTKYSKRTIQRMLLIKFGWNTYQPAKGKEEDFLDGFAPYGVVNDGQGTELHVAELGNNPDLKERLGDALDQIAAWRKSGLPVIGLAPVAAWDLKRWPLESFQDLIHRYVKQTGGGMVLFGGSGDKEVEGLFSGVEPNGVSMVGRTSFMESAYVASLLDTVITNDTGMLHLSEAVGTDVVALFGPTSRELGYFPVRNGSQVMEVELECRPCTRTGQGVCKNEETKACLYQITPEEVLNATLEVIKNRVLKNGKEKRIR